MQKVVVQRGDSWDQPLKVREVSAPSSQREIGPAMKNAYRGLKAKGREDLFEEKLGEGYTHVAVGDGPWRWGDEFGGGYVIVPAALAFTKPGSRTNVYRFISTQKPGKSFAMQRPRNWTPAESDLTKGELKAYKTKNFVAFEEPRDLAEVTREAEQHFARQKGAKR